MKLDQIITVSNALHWQRPRRRSHAPIWFSAAVLFGMIIAAELYVLGCEIIARMR